MGACAWRMLTGAVIRLARSVAPGVEPGLTEVTPALEVDLFRLDKHGLKHIAIYHTKYIQGVVKIRAQ